MLNINMQILLKNYLLYIYLLVHNHDKKYLILKLIKINDDIYNYLNKINIFILKSEIDSLEIYFFIVTVKKNIEDNCNSFIIF
jgi:hypothetical protein